MQALLYANLTSLSLSSSLSGGAFSWPKIVAGSDLTIGLRFAKTINGTPTEVYPKLNALKVSLGKADARPTAGTFKLHLGTDPASAGANLTAALDYDISAADLATALSALTDFDAVTVTKENDTYRCVIGDGLAEVAIAAVENTLRPVAFLEVNAVQSNDGTFVHEIRLTTTPVAQTVDFAAVAPPAPTITEARAGGASGESEWNELQQLTVDPEFRGTFEIRRGYLKTVPLATPLDADTISDALQPLADDDSEFIVTEIDDGVLIEFSGAMGGLNQDLLTIAIVEQPAGDPTFTLRTDRAELWSLLGEKNATTGELKLPLEIALWLEDPEADEDDKKVVFKVDGTITAPVDVEDRNAASEIAWNQPRGSRAGHPFTPGQVLIGNRSYQQTIGDGSATSFAINHNLGVASLQISVRENATNGRLLSAPQDFNIVFDSDNALTITPQADVAGTLSSAAWLVVITMADDAVYEAHGHSIAEIAGLRDELDAIGATLQEVLDLVPTGALTERTVAGGTPVFEVRLPRFAEMYPSRQTLTLEAEQTIDDIAAASLPKDGGLVPAINLAAATDLDSGTELPAIDETNTGAVLRNNTGATITVAGSRGRRSVQLLNGQYAGNDGVHWYRVARDPDDNNTWYPTDFDRVLFEIPVNSKLLIAKRRLDLSIGLRVAMRSIRQANPAKYAWDTTKNTRGQWELVIEHGALTSEASPSTTGANLKGVTWNATPILAHRMILTQDVALHSFGVQIIRDAAGVLSANAIYYGASEAGASVPASADFILRARLRRFDIEDGVSDPGGIILLQGLDQSIISATSDDALGKVIIS